MQTDTSVLALSSNSEFRSSYCEKPKPKRLFPRYTFAYLVCHALTLINVIVNINLLNTFFDGRFTEFGTRQSKVFFSQGYIKYQPIPILDSRIFFLDPKHKTDSIPRIPNTKYPKPNSRIFQLNPIQMSCRWLASEEKHSALPDVFPRVRQPQAKFAF